MINISQTMLAAPKIEFAVLSALSCLKLSEQVYEKRFSDNLPDLVQRNEELVTHQQQKKAERMYRR